MRALKMAAVGALMVAVLSVTGAVASDTGEQGAVQAMPPNHGGQPARTGGATTVNNLSYRGGVSGIGVETAPTVYVVYWGSQWSNDPSGEAAYLNAFLGGLYGSQDAWSTSTVQYCQNVSSGTVDCTTASSPQYVGHPGASPLAGVWYDNGASAPTRPKQSQLANEAAKAAAHFGNTTAASNASVQYVIATAHGNNAAGFGVQYCAWHSSVSSSYGRLAYTNLPYISDAGASCGQNFVNAGAAGKLDGVSIVEGHEYTETITDQYPSGGWLDGNGAENGDKCAWISSGQGGAANVTLGTGTFAVQSLWSNNFPNSNGTKGNCAISYQDATNQH